MTQFMLQLDLEPFLHLLEQGPLCDAKFQGPVIKKVDLTPRRVAKSYYVYSV